MTNLNTIHGENHGTAGSLAAYLHRSRKRVSSGSYTWVWSFSAYSQGRNSPWEHSRAYEDGPWATKAEAVAVAKAWMAEHPIS